MPVYFSFHAACSALASIAVSTLHKLAQARPKFSKTWAWPMLVWTRKTWARPRLTWPRPSPTQNLGQVSLGRAQVFRVHTSMGQAQVFENLGRAWASLCSVDTAVYALDHCRAYFRMGLVTLCGPTNLQRGLGNLKLWSTFSLL